MKITGDTLCRAFITLSAFYFSSIMENNFLRFIVVYGACYACTKIIVSDDE